MIKIYNDIIRKLDKYNKPINKQKQIKDLQKLNYNTKELKETFSNISDINGLRLVELYEGIIISNHEKQIFVKLRENEYNRVKFRFYNDEDRICVKSYICDSYYKTKELKRLKLLGKYESEQIK